MALNVIDQVRLLIGDRTPDNELTDPEVQHFLDGAGGLVEPAAACAALSLARIFAAKAIDQTTGKMSIQFSKRAAEYRQTALELGGTAVTEIGPFFTGGLSKQELQTSKEDTDLVQPAFRRETHEDPETDLRDDLHGHG